jgi:hypothetical protein
MSFDLTGFTKTQFNFIMILTKAQKLHKIHLSDDFTLSMLLIDKKQIESASVCCFTQYSRILTADSWS